MATNVSDVEALREAYREARSKISNFADPLERDVGLAALRLEATQAYRLSAGRRRHRPAIRLSARPPAGTAPCRGRCRARRR